MNDETVIPIVLLHASEEEPQAEQLAKSIEEFGYKVWHTGHVLVGDVVVQELSERLAMGGPVVICGTARAAGSKWLRKIVAHLQGFSANGHPRIFPVRMDSDADLEAVGLSAKIAECSIDRQSGLSELRKALTRHFPSSGTRELMTPTGTDWPTGDFDDWLTPVVDYSESALRAFREKLRPEIREFRLPDSLDPNTFLVSANLALNRRLYSAAVLLFAAAPEHRIRSAYIQCVKYSGVDRTAAQDGREFSGPLISQLSDAMTFIENRIGKAGIIVPGSVEARTEFQFPMVCLRELLANALCHRDYLDTKRHTHVRIFDDKIEIVSPGKWAAREIPERLELQLTDLISEPVSRNERLASALRWVSLVETEGSGIPNATMDCEHKGAPPPSVIFTDEMVKVTIYPRSDWDIVTLDRRGAHVVPSAHTVTRAEKRAEIRIVHALQPAPHFHGREELVQGLAAWVSDLTSPDRVWSLVAAGGTGKTAVVEKVVAGMRAGEANVLVWSFYEQPDADAFLRECNQLFLGEDEGPAGGRLERLERGLRDGRPHLIVLDGLERVQADAGGGKVRGELSDHSLKLLLRAMAAGLGRARALVTSRYPLVDLQDWTNRGYRDTSLDDLSPEAAVAVLRGWGVVGDDDALRVAAAQVGYHALSVAVLGSYLHSFADGRIEAVEAFELDAVTGDDPRAAKLARVLAYYAERLPEEERELLARISVFPRGVTIDLLGVLVDAGGEVAGLLLKAKPRLVALLGSLRARGLVFQYQSDEAVTWTAHPFLRERFRGLLGCPAERVFDVVAQALGAGLEKRPHTKPTDPATLDRYERLIEATRLAGREQEAFELYWYGLGAYEHLGWVLGEYERGYRILAAFSATGSPADLGVTMAPLQRSLLATHLSLFAMNLGRLEEARAIRRLDDRWKTSLAEPKETSIGLQNSSEVAFDLGRLAEARGLATEAKNEAETASDDTVTKNSLAYRASAAHALGDVAAARADFAAATEPEGEALYSLSGAQHARHHLDLGDLDAARALADHGLAKAYRHGWNDEIPWFAALLARIDLAEGRDPTPHLDAIRAWTSRTGDMEYIIEAHLLAARYLLTRGDIQSALGEAETGLLHAVACGFGLLRIELLVALARIRLAWPDPPRAIQAAREALDLAAHPDCGYAWGEADAAQAWGEAYFANGELALARRAFTRALDVRRRIEHPGASETERWLART